MPDLPPLVGGAGPRDEAVEEAIARALDARAEQVRPADRFSDLVDRVLETEDAPAPARFRTVVIASVVALAVGAAAPFLIGGGGGAATPVAPSTSEPAPVAPASATASLLTQQQRVSVYYLGPDGFLYREYHDLPTQEDRLTTAVAAVLNVVPHDPGLSSLWTGGQVNSAKVVGTRITVDISAAAFSGFTSREAAERAINQIVYTAVAAVGDRFGERTVQVLRDGSPNLPILGAPATDFVREDTIPLAPLMIDDPAGEAAVAAGTVRVGGWQKVELTNPAVTWQVFRGNALVTSGTTSASGNTLGWRRWQAEVTLPAGRYTLRVTTPQAKRPVERVFTVA